MWNKSKIVVVDTMSSKKVGGACESARPAILWENNTWNLRSRLWDTRYTRADFRVLLESHWIFVPVPEGPINREIDINKRVVNMKFSFSIPERHCNIDDARLPMCTCRIYFFIFCCKLFWIMTVVAIFIEWYYNVYFLRIDLLNGTLKSFFFIRVL